MGLSTSNFQYHLPGELIAQSPLRRRDRSRLMVLARRGGPVKHHLFADLPSLLREGDLLVLNDTRVLPAKFTCRRRAGGRIEGLFLLEPLPGKWEVLLRNAGRCRRGEALELVGTNETKLHLQENLHLGRWRVRVEPPSPAADILQRAGRTPLPPYIHRVEDANDGGDRRRYQTVYASRAGAVAAPTAGLHFTRPLLAKLRRHGIETVHLTLHVGLGTFAPVRCDDLAAHKMHAEWYELPAEAAERINAARRQKRRIVAVGTTSVRVLETVAATTQPTSPGPGGLLCGSTGWTDIFIYPPFRFRATDALITNFHLPGSTLVMLAAAFCSPGKTDGVNFILNAYEEAIRLCYRFYSYGDAMLIE